MPWQYRPEGGLFARAATALALCTLVAAPAATAAPPAEPPAGPEAEPAREAAPAEAPASPRTIRFNFKGASFEQVIEFFSRASGLPVVWEQPPPEGTLDYLSPEAYALPDALRILNIILQSRGVMLRSDEEMLYLQSLSEMQREDIPTFMGRVPDEITDDQIITVVRPLDITAATTLAETIGGMIATYGSVTALAQQNALVITETAAQIRRINRILDELDREDPEGVIEVIAIRHARAEDLMKPLTALLATRVEKYVVNEKGKQTKIEEDTLPGLNITVDDRTNSLVAKGVRSRIDKLKEAVEILDRPATDSTRTVRSFTLATIAPTAALGSLQQVWASLEEGKRPTALAFDETARLTVVGSQEAIDESAILLRELDGSVLEEPDGAASSIVAVPLESATPEAMIAALRPLLSRRQQATLRLVAGPDGRTLVVSGPVADVAAVRGILPVLDRPRPGDVRVALLRLEARDPADALRRAHEIYARERSAAGADEDPAWSIEGDYDADSRTYLAVATPATLDRFAAALRAAEDREVVSRETRELEVTHAAPSAIAPTLDTLARRLLDPRDGSSWTPPRFDAIDELDLLLVEAEPGHHAAIATLVETLDRIDPADREFRVVSLAGVAAPEALMDRAATAWERLSAGIDPAEMPAPTVDRDDLTGHVLLAGTSRAVALYERAIQEAKRLLPPARDGRLFELRQADAGAVAESLRELVRTTLPADPWRSVPEPEVSVVARTNALYVVAEPAQHATIERLIARLDVFQPEQMPPLRLLQVRAADAAQVAGMLRRRYDARSAEQRREAPVEVDADAATNTLIVTAHPSVYEEIQEFVAALNENDGTAGNRQTTIFPLERARAADVAAALEKLYPEPPVPVDRRGNPMNHLREPKEVYVSADAATNTLIIEAPAERRASFEALVAQLDRVELPPTAELRTYRVDRGDPEGIAATLTELARRGVMSAQPADGSKPVGVLVQAEPKSRTLIVAGDATTFAQTEAILADLQAVPVERSLRVFEMRSGDPAAIADRARRLYAEQSAELPDAGAVSIEVDPGSGALLVLADDEAMTRVGTILSQLERAAGTPPAIELVALEHADAVETVGYLRDLVASHRTLGGAIPGPPPVFESIERTNSIMVSGPTELMPIVRALVARLDEPESTAMPPLRILQLRAADAGNLAQALSVQYDRRSVEERSEKPVTITADSATNALVVAAHPDLMPEIAGIVQELNETGRMDVEGREIRIFPLKVARAEELATTLDEMFPEPPLPVDSRGRPLAHLREPREVVVRADSQTNSIIVDAPVHRMAGFEALVEQLDRQRITDETTIRVYPVAHAEVDRVAETLRSLAQSGALLPASRDRRVQVLVTADEASRSLVVSGPNEVFERVEQLLAELDVRRAGPATTLRFFRLEHARADALAELLRRVLASRIEEDLGGAATDVAALLDVAADRKTNTLIISAPEEIQAVADELLRRLDVPGAAVGDATIRVRPLVFADAREVADSLAGALGSMTSPATGDPVDARIVPAPGSNALILVGLPIDLDAIEALVGPLDARPATDAIDARTFALDHASARSIAPVVEELLTDQQASDPRLVMERIRRSRGDLDFTPRIRVRADDRTNSLIVSGPQRTVALAESIIGQLDRDEETGPRAIEVFTPANARPEALAALVTDLFDATTPGGRRARTTVTAEPASGAVLVVGPRADVDRAMGLLAERDAAAPSAPAMELRVVDLRHGDAAAVARIVGPMIADPARWPESLRRAERAGVAIAQPTVTADPSANRILLSAPAELVAAAARIVAELDRPAADGAPDVRIFTLAVADAEGAATAIRSALEARAAARPGAAAPSVVAEPSSNAVVVAADAESLAVAEAIVSRLDEGRSVDEPQVRTVVLRYARAEAVAPIVQGLFGGEEIPVWMRLDLMRVRARGQQIDEPTSVRVAADPRLNAVVLSAPPAMLATAEEMVRQLDVDPMADAARRRDVRVLPVVNADATELAASIVALFDEPDATGAAAPTVRVDTASNTLLVRATAEQFERIAAVVERIDAATIATARQMRLVPIDASRATAEEVAESLRRLLEHAEGGVEVITLEELIERRSAKPALGPTSRRDDAGPRDPRLALAAALALGATEEATEDDASAAASDDPPRRTEPAIVVAVDPETNAIILLGAPRQVERAAELARRIQEELPRAPGRIHSIQLPDDVDADRLARLVDQALRRLAPAGGAPGDLRERVSLIGDAEGRTLVVTASDRDFATVADLVTALARPPSADPIAIKVYALRTVTAERAAASIARLVQPGDRRRGQQAQRMRDVAVRLLDGEAEFEAIFDPARLTVAPDPGANAIVVAGPPAAIPFVDRFIELIDQSPIDAPATLRTWPLRHAKAAQLADALRDVFRARFRSLRDAPGSRAFEPWFEAETRTNTLLVTAAPEQLAEVDALIADLDRDLGGDRHALRVVELAAARPSEVARLLDEAIVGSDQARRTGTTIVADDGSGLLLIRADEPTNAEIDALIARVDRHAADEIPVRSIVLERADAQSVAATLQRFFDDRARIASAGRGRREQVRRVTITGDAASRTLLIACSDSEFAEIQGLIEQFDSPQATDAWTFRLFALEHAKAAEIEETIVELLNNLTWSQPIFFWGPQRGSQNQRGSYAVHADTRLNALIVTGEGQSFDIVEQLVEVLDQPAGQATRVVRLHRLEHVDPGLAGEVIEALFASGAGRRRWWEPPDPNELLVRYDEQTRTIVVSGTESEQQEIAEVLAALDVPSGDAATEVAVLAVAYAEAPELARTLSEFLDERAGIEGRAGSRATIRASRSSSALVVAAPSEELATIRDLVQRLDRPDAAGDRVVEIIALHESDADEIARIIREQFSRRGGTGVVVTPDARTNSVVVNGPREEFAKARALIDRLDARDAADETVVRTYALAGARAPEAMRILTDALELDASGRTKGKLVKLDPEDEAVPVSARIVADPRSNSLVVTATAESLPVLEGLIRRLDEVPASSPVEYRIIRLEHAMASEVALTLDLVGKWGDDDGASKPEFDYERKENRLIVAATADQHAQIRGVIDQLDVPSERERRTEFVPLRFAEAAKVREALSFFYGTYAVDADTPGKRSARIVADPATNSLVISADSTEWENLRALLDSLDSEEYDASLQLRVLPLRHADAASVAQAINEAFGPDVGRRGSERSDRGAEKPAEGREGEDPNGRRERDAPAVLVQADEWVKASAERQTNSIVVSANRANLKKIERIVGELDVADAALLPPPRVIAVGTGDPERIAESIEALYRRDDSGGRREVRVVADPGANVIIVRAAEDEYAQILALARALESQSSQGGITVEIVRLEAAPARRVADALREAYATRADQANQPLTIEVDAAGNSLVVAASAPLIAEIRATARELDALAPGAGQGIFIIELQNVSPDEVARIVETIGLTRPTDDAVSRLVSEPISVTPLRGRNAVVVTANPGDREIVVGLLKALDDEPALAVARVRIVRLRNAEAGAIAALLGEMLAPAEQQAGTPLAAALREQVRRLSVRRDGLREQDLDVDLALPVRVIPDAVSNSIVIASTEANVAALEELIGTLDRLPVTDAVTVQLFPLENIAADDFVRIVRDLFEQGKQLGRVPGTDVVGIPQGIVGRALLDEVALSVDQRTNVVVAAGKEDSVAFVEVMTRRLDAEVSAGWLEPRVVPLRFADPVELSETINAVLVEGASTAPGAGPLQRQVGRLRMARIDEEGGRVLEADVFQPMTRLVVRPEPALNAILLVGTPANLEVVQELVGMLDVEAASPDASVRVYPVIHASAARLAPTLRRIFEQQVRAKSLREEDRVVVESDERSNALVVSTSPRSFVVLERLLEMLDAEIAPDIREIRSIELEHASAARLAQMIQQLMDARLERIRRIQPEAADLERATVMSDPRTNSLIVAAGNEAFEVVQRLVADLDRSTIGDADALTVIPLERSNADRLAETVRAVMERRYAELPAELKRAQMPLVLIDQRSNSLMVAANPEDLDAIKGLVARLEETPSDPAVGLYVIDLPEGASATALSPMIQRLMRERQRSLGPGQKPSDEIAIEADETGNTLIVAASIEHFEVVQGLVDALVEAGADEVAGRTFEIIPVVASRAADVADLLDDLYVAEARRTRGDGAVEVRADARSNAVVVKGSASDVRAIRDLVQQLDGARPATVVEIKYVALQSANAIETVSLIDNVLSGRGLGPRRGDRQATVLKYLQELAGEEGGQVTETEVSAAIRESIVLTPDLRTNTIIVSAPRDSMELIERMIRDLDSTSTGAKRVRIFELKNADALAMAEILQDLFNLRQGSSMYVLKPREEGPAIEGGDPSALAGFGGTDLTAVPDERQQLSITVDSRTNSLLVSGTPTYLDLVEDVVSKLDAREANERDVFVYPLRNAQAEDVARVVGEFVRVEQEKIVSTLSDDELGSAARLLEREVTIQGDVKSNAVLVSVSPRYRDRVEEMIRQLDVDPPQVLIQVMLAEISLDSSSEWGVDMEFRANISGASITAGFGLATAFVDGDGVPTLTLASADFDLMIKALQAQGRVSVLSNPSIVAANNEPANLQVGQTIRVPSGSTFSSGNTNTVTEEKELGVKLDVTPTINPDGYVRLTVVPEISILTEQTTQINEELDSPVINVRKASTTVTVRDGQTVVLAGLIQDRFERVKRQVPLLGDIPLIGILFQNIENRMAKTELLIVLTPHVISGHIGDAKVDRIDEATGEALDRLTIPTWLKDQIREGRIDLGDGLYDSEGNMIEIAPEDREQEGGTGDD